MRKCSIAALKGSAGMENSMAKKRKKKRSAVSVFFTGFLKSLLVIALLFLTGFGSYKASLFYFNLRGVSSGSRASALIRDLYGSVSAEDISKNLIYGLAEDGSISELILEIFNTKTGNMDYVTIPVKTEFTISNDLYQKLTKAGSDVPQIIRLSTLHKYFEDETLYEYGSLLTEDILGIDISYYTVLEKQIFDKTFTETEGYFTFTEEYKTELMSVEKDETAIKEYLETAYQDCTSNLSLRSKKKYAAAYVQWGLQNTHYYLVPGAWTEDTYTVSTEEAKTLLQELLANLSYSSPQSTSDKKTDSKEYKIQILNASQINGLAAKYKTLLENEGYQVAEIGNYTGSSLVQSQSRIVVSKEGIGEDLLDFLDEGEIEIANDLPEGIDIRIILGSDANQ
jgi:hypothetical protein